MGYFGVMDGNDEGHFGAIDDYHDKQKQLKVASQLIEEVIADCIPFIEKTAYLEALEKSPHLIGIETNPLWFLTYEKWNIWSAAQRIVKYWEWKRTLFGDVRTFLPISDLSGNGALDELDIQVVQSGYIAILPKDDRGNYYVVLNRSRAGEPPPWDSDIKIRLRVFFYQFCDNLGEYYRDRHHLDDENGVIVLGIIETLLPSPTVNLRDMITEAIPVRILHVHNIFFRTRSNALFMEKYIVPSFLAVNAPLLKFTNHTMHYCSSPSEAKIKLEQHDVPEYCIPTMLGGSWSYASYNDWFFEASKQAATVNQNHMQHELLEESTRDDCFAIWDDGCSQNKPCSLDQSDPFGLELDILDHVVACETDNCTVCNATFPHLDDAKNDVIMATRNCANEENNDNRGISLSAHYNTGENNTTTSLISKHHFVEQIGCRDPVNSSMLINEWERNNTTLRISDDLNENLVEKNGDVSSVPDMVREDSDSSKYVTSVCLKTNLDLCPRDFEFLKCGAFMILPFDSQDYCVLSYEPDKAISDDFELHRCCFHHCLNLLTMTNKQNLSIIILAYLDQEFVQSKSELNDTFIGIIDTFPNIKLDSIHIFFESVCLGWYSYQESAKCVSLQMFGDLKEKTSFHMFPTVTDGSDNDSEGGRPHIMAHAANIRSIHLFLDDLKEGDLISKYNVHASSSFCYPLDFYEAV